MTNALTRHGPLYIRIAAELRAGILSRRWQPGDVAIWDNRATQHRAIADFGKQRRHLRRATIAGTIPVALDGSRSRALKPEPVPVAALEAAE